MRNGNNCTDCICVHSLPLFRAEIGQGLKWFSHLFPFHFTAKQTEKKATKLQYVNNHQSFLLWFSMFQQIGLKIYKVDLWIYYALKAYAKLDHSAKRYIALMQSKTASCFFFSPAVQGKQEIKDVIDICLVGKLPSWLWYCTPPTSL